MASDRIDWTRAVVKVTVPVQHTVMETVQEIEVPLVQLPAILAALNDRSDSPSPGEQLSVSS